MRHWPLTLTMVAVTAIGCAKKQAEPTAFNTAPDRSLSQLDTAPSGTTDPYATDPYATDPYVSDTASRTWDRGGETRTGGGQPETTLIADAGRTGARTHVVQKGDTLYKLARQYYNNQSKWKDIWEANKTRVPNKDKLEVGTRLIIP